MSRSFGPVVIVNRDTNQIDKVHCYWCIFLNNPTKTCSHPDRSNPRKIPDADNTPDWCEMKADAIRDAEDMANGVTHYVMRWSGRRTDEPREVYVGIPSEAARQFRLTARDAKRGTVTLEDATGNTLATWPE